MGTRISDTRVLLVSKYELTDFTWDCTLAAVFASGMISNFPNIFIEEHTPYTVPVLCICAGFSIWNVYKARKLYKKFCERRLSMDVAIEPSSKPNPTVMMEWETLYLFDSETVPGIECSNCGFTDIYDFEIAPLPDKCPECGALAINGGKHA